MQHDCVIALSNCWLITIGNDVTFAPGVYILAHEASTKKYLNYTRIGLTSIGDFTFTGARATVLGGVKIGSRCVIGAGSVVTKDVPDNCVYAGNPAKFLCATDEYIEKQKQLLKTRPAYDENWTMRKNITPAQKEKMIADLKNGAGFVE